MLLYNGTILSAHKQDSKDQNVSQHNINSEPCGEELTLECGQFHNVNLYFFSKWGKHSLPGWRDTQEPYCTNNTCACVCLCGCWQY